MRLWRRSPRWCVALLRCVVSPAYRKKVWYPFRDQIRIARWKQEDEDKEVSAKNLWHAYLHRGAMGNRAWRFVPMAAMLWLFNLLLLAILGFPEPPYRGSVSWVVDFATVQVSVLLLLAALFFVVDATRLCGKFIENLAEKSTHWPMETVRKYNEHRKMDPEDLREWLDMQLISRRTKTAGSLLFCPFVALFLMIISRLRYFDNWHTPIGLVIVFAVFAGWAVYCVVLLRGEAKKRQQIVLGHLRDNLVRVSGDTPGEKRRGQQIREAIDEIESIREGAFAPWTQHPLVRALILPAGGLGLVLLEFI